jgi:hypothetical protein
MKRFTTITLILIFLVSGTLISSCNDQKIKKQESENNENHEHDKMMHNMNMGKDNRVSLNVSPQQAQHQLMNMRKHVVAIQSIITFLSKDEFEKASEVAHAELGLTPEMKMMCTSFDNPEFVELGLRFHKSADSLGNILSTKDKNESLKALSITLDYCVNCHATFRQ